MTRALPDGLRVFLDPAARWVTRETLVGGAPRRIVRLSEAGQRGLRALEVGQPAPEAVRALGRRLVDAGLAHPLPVPRSEQAVTVVVPVRDRHDELERCLAALAPGTDVLVVDDGSGAAAAIAGVARRYGARLVRRRTAGGPAAARNAALREPTADLVAFLDSDCVAPPGWVAALAGHFDDPLVGAVAPRVRPLPTPGAIGRYLAARSPLDLGPRPAAVVPGMPVSYVPSAALVVRRSALGAGFDEALRYGEDVDLVWRLHEAGARVRYDPSVVVSHREPRTVWAHLRRRFRYGTSAGPLAARHPGRLAPAVMRPWPALAAVLLLTGRRHAAAAVALQQGLLLGDRMRRVGLPRRLGVRWFAEATGHAALSGARYATTVGPVPALGVLALTRRPRGLALLALPALTDWARRRPSLDPLRWTALALADDAAYGAGVWAGVLRTRQWSAVLPAFGAPGGPEVRPSPRTLDTPSTPCA